MADRTKELREQVDQLRESYYRAYPRQRWHVAKQRIDTTESGPNMLVAYVSAIEGMLRSLVIWGATSDSRPSWDIYDKYRLYNVQNLYEEYLKQQDGSGLVPASVYELVKCAVDYRNLLAHECTYLGQDKYPELIVACEEFLDALRERAGIE